MKKLFDTSSYRISALVTKTYSTSFSLACGLLAPKIRPAIYAIYGFVRYADEIVDSFQGWDQAQLLDEFEKEYHKAHARKISLNPVLHAFQEVVHQYGLERSLIDDFMQSMKMDLHIQEHGTFETYNTYIYGSAEVVGLMCLKVFVNGDEEQYQKLTPFAKRLGAAFQKVNFLRDIGDDRLRLERNYFPHLSQGSDHRIIQREIIEEIDQDFKAAFPGILQLPKEARLGVYTAYRYYKKLWDKLKHTELAKIQNQRFRVSDTSKMLILGTSYLQCRLNRFSSI